MAPLFDLTIDLLELAQQQRQRLNLRPALLLFRAAGRCTHGSESDPGLGEALTALVSKAEQLKDTLISEDDVDGLLQAASELEKQQSSNESLELGTARAAASIGEADTLRLLGQTTESAAMLAQPSLASVPGPCALQAFWLEAFGGIGGGEHGRCRLDVLLVHAQKMAAATQRAPEGVWRVMGASCEQRPSGIVEEDEEEDINDPLGLYEGRETQQRWPTDGVISVSGVRAMNGLESLLDVAIKCMWSRRPRDAILCLQRLIEVGCPATHMHVHVHTHAHMHVNMHTRARAHACTCTHVRVSVCACVRAHGHAHVRVCTYRVHVCMCASPWQHRQCPVPVLAAVARRRSLASGSRRMVACLRIHTATDARPPRCSMRGLAGSTAAAQCEMRRSPPTPSQRTCSRRSPSQSQCLHQRFGCGSMSAGERPLN